MTGFILFNRFAESAMPIGRSGGILCACLFWIVAQTAAVGAAHTDPAAVFDAAARSYEQGRFREAATRYESVRTNGIVTPSILYNLGNAWLKQGHIGRAIAFYRQAQQLSPRDSDIESNLKYARSKVAGAAIPPVGVVPAVLARLSAGEWGTAAVVANLVCGVLLVVRDLRPKTREKISGLAWVVSFLAISLFAIALFVGIQTRRPAGVIITQASVRFGPLQESQVAFTLPDGAEVRATDRKGDWTEIVDGTHRRGWVPATNLVMLGSVIAPQERR